jgi:hypothetical protein
VRITKWSYIVGAAFVGRLWPGLPKRKAIFVSDQHVGNNANEYAFVLKCFFFKVIYVFSACDLEFIHSMRAMSLYGTQLMLKCYCHNAGVVCIRTSSSKGAGAKSRISRDLLQRRQDLHAPPPSSGSPLGFRAREISPAATLHFPFGLALFRPMG